MSRTKPISKDEVNRRALGIACRCLERSGVTDEKGENMDAAKIRRWVLRQARRELIDERKRKPRAL